MARISKLIQEWRDSGVALWMVAVVLGSAARYTIWPAYVLLRRRMISLGCSSEYTWVVSAVYFSFWVWLFVLLAREGKRYPSMILDAVCGGWLLTVAAAMHELSVRTALAELGFSAAPWVTLLCVVAFVVARSAQPHQRNPSDGRVPRL